MLFEETAKTGHFFDRKPVPANSNLQKALSTFYWNRKLQKNSVSLLIKYDSFSMAYKKEESSVCKTLKNCLFFSALQEYAN